MSNFTELNYKAIAWFAEQNTSVPQLSAWPKVRFRNKDTGEFFEENVTTLTILHGTYLKELSKEKARQRRAEAKKAQAVK